jgi:glycosyltransferase involved in cell wall biosynthesis
MSALAPLPEPTTYAAPLHSGGRRLRCLWIGRYIPHPMNEGAKVYSAQLAASLADAGMFVRVLGFGDPNCAPRREELDHVAVPGVRRHDIRGLVSRLPLAAAVDSTGAYKAMLERQLQETWDVIVFDSYATGWSLERCERYRSARKGATVLVHVSHNHEAALWHALAENTTAGAARRWAVKQNASKVGALERRLTESVDLLSTITKEDGLALGYSLQAERRLTLLPGYDGPVATARTLTAGMPRRVVIVGSFNWVIKRENLCRFLEHADPLFARHAVELVVAGEMPPALKQSLSARCVATRMTGFVSDLAPLLSESRIAVVPELIGGGFKLKFLDYLFARVPVATVRDAAAGLPPALREHLITAGDFAALSAAIVDRIDDLDDLNRRQSAAFSQAQSLFRWDERGAQLYRAIATLLGS